MSQAGPTSRARGGFSLIELLLAIAVLALALAGVLDMLRTMTAASAVAGAHAALQRDADFALSHITARIRASTVPEPWTGLKYKTVDDLRATEFGNMAFFLDGAGKVIEADGGERRTLAEAVRSFDIAVVSTAGSHPLLEITLAMERDNVTVNAAMLVRFGSAR